MNVYEKIRNVLPLDSQSQGTGNALSMFFILLDALATAENAHPTADTYANPAQELLAVRLAKYADTFGYKTIIAPLVSSHSAPFGG